MKGTPAVVVVEDSDIDYEMAVRAMREIDPRLNIQRSVDGQGLGQMVAQHTPRLVILDCQLPGRTGVELVREIRSLPAGAGIKIVVFSTSLPPAHPTEGAMGADDYRTKPMGADEYTAEVKSFVTRWLHC